MTAWTLHHGDALTILPTIDTPIDAVICDPPYNSGGRTPTERTIRTARSKYLTEGGRHHGQDLGDFTGDNRDQRSYGYWLTLLLAQCHRLTRPGGAALVFTDWRQLPTTTDALQAAGYTWRGIATWHKPVARPQKGRLKQECEFIVWGSAGPMIPDNNPVYLPGLYTGSQPRGTQRQHITQKPVEVMRQLVRIAPEGGTVLDPCAGSGTTGTAALQEGRDFIGIELSASYARVARERLTAESKQEDVYDIHVRPSGTSKEAGLRRLRKDAPELHAEVLAGHLTAHAAMVKAGFRRKTPPKRLSHPPATLNP